MKPLLIVLSFICIAGAVSAAVFTTNGSDKGAFVRALAPNLNYGGGGALSVSGTNATTGNPTNGAFDTFISFNTAAMVTSFNSVFGPSNWVITTATLNLTANLAPGNALFNYGTGSFEVRWIANDTWITGTGTPNAPTTNGITYSEEPSYLNTNTDTNLGAFTFTGAAKLSCPLALPAPFVNNMEAGGEVGFFMTAISPALGYVFYSRNYAGNTNSPPYLVVSATSQPGLAGISVSGTNLLLAATNGVAGGTYYVLTSTNLAAPVQWTTVLTNVLAAGGNFVLTVTNGANSNAQQFFILQTY